jgi:hypothetical protein
MHSQAGEAALKMMQLPNDENRHGRAFFCPTISSILAVVTSLRKASGRARGSRASRSIWPKREASTMSEALILLFLLFLLFLLLNAFARGFLACLMFEHATRVAACLTTPRRIGVPKKVRGEHL